MRAGELKWQIQIQLPPVGKNADGDPNTDWTKLVDVWAKKEDLSGRELLAAHAAQSEITTRFRIRYRDDITSKMRVVMGEEIYNIKAVLDRAGSRVELQLMCSSGLNNG
nr:MAG TPA: Putative head tail adaptor [Caudoviricetes sp.]